MTRTMTRLGWAGPVLALGLLGCGDGAPAGRPGPPTERIAGPAGALHLDDGGSGGIPVVLVHGYGGDAQQWSAQLAHLRTSRRAVALDLRSHGKSDPPPTPDYSAEALAADIAAVVDSLELVRFVLVGHSMGGAAAIAYAGAHPDRVAGLVMVGAPGRMPPEQGRQLLAQIEANYDSVTAWYWNQLLTDAQPAVRDRVLSRMRSVPREPSLAIIRALTEFDPLPALARYHGPKLAIVASRENTANDLHNQVPGLPSHTIAPASHWVHMDQPTEFNRVLDEFLSQIPSYGSPPSGAGSR
jgi:pimeloyl-ACP methyl ester carboxylesterase